jgi:DNA-binding MarR family transcriptional regulator
MGGDERGVVGYRKPEQSSCWNKDKRTHICLDKYIFGNRMPRMTQKLSPLETLAGTPPTFANSLSALLAMVRSELVRALEAEFASQDVDLTFTQYLILKKAQQLGPVSATELARSVELDGGAMTRQLDQLERKGYLLRTPHAQDRRALRIELTDAGRTLWQDNAFVCSNRVMAAAQRSLDKTESAQLHDYLERVLLALRDKN